MYRLCAITLLCVVASVSLAGEVAAQQTRAIVGIVRSASDAEPLAGVRVRVVEASSQTETNADGRFALANLPRIDLHLVFERIGVTPDTVEVALGITNIRVSLLPRAVQVQPLVAEAATLARERFETLPPANITSLDPLEIWNAPTLLEPDVARVAQLLPGTVTKNDYSVGMNVRGGETDQNLIRIDGTTVLNPFHLGGLFSTFDVSAVENVDLIKGALPASYGGRLSSVMDVELRQGGEQFGVRGSISPLASRISVEGPIGATGASFLVGARRTYADAVAKAFSASAFDYYFADGFVKVAMPLGEGRISTTGYWGRDALDLPWVDAEPGREAVDFAFSWGNRLAGLNWQQPLGPIELDTHVDISEFTSRFELVPGTLNARNSVHLVTARTALSFSLAERSDVELGVGVESYRIDYESGAASVGMEVPDGVWVGGERVPYDFGDMVLASSGLDLEYRPRIWFAHLENIWRPAAPLIFRLGARALHVGDGADFTGVSPRLGVKAFLAADLALSVSAGRSYQAIRSIRDQEIPLTLFDFWVGVDEAAPVSRADEAAVGIERWFGDGVSVSIEGYAKALDNLTLRNHADDPRVRGDEFLIATGDAWGSDVIIRRHRGSIRGWIAYSYAKVRREVGDERFPPAHDRRHTVNVVVQAPGPLGSAMSVHWGYGSGLPYTGIVGQWLHREYNAELNVFERPREEGVSTTINGERYPHYSRLDVGLRWEFEWLRGLWRPFVNVVNVYNRQNVFAYVFDFGNIPPTRSGWSQLPILPTVGVEFSW